MNKKEEEVLKQVPPVDKVCDYYGYYFYCSNCQRRSYRYILKGVRYVTVQVECDHCGCQAL